MDNLTHGLIGYTLYKTTAPLSAVDERTERGLLLTAVIASELPDIDMVSAFLGNGASLEWHRTYTHSLPGIFIFAVAVGLIAARIWPGIPQRRLCFLAFGGGLLHSFFDVLTAYGTKVFLPWSDIPYAWDILPIVDPILLLFLVLIVWTSRKSFQRITLWSLVLSMVFYVGLRAEIHNLVTEQLYKSMPYAGKTVVMPKITSTLRWRFCAVVPGGIACGNINYQGEIAQDLFIPDESANPAVQAVQTTKTVNSFSRRFPDFVGYIVSNYDELWHVKVFDARYASPGNLMFAGELLLNKELKVIRESD